MAAKKQWYAENDFSKSTYWNFLIFYFYLILNNENFKMEVEQRNFVTHEKINFTCQSKSFTSIFFTRYFSACELQPFFCHYLAKYIYSWSQTAKTAFSHLNYNLSSRGLEVMGSRKNRAREGNTPLPLPSSVSFARLFLSCAVTSKRLLRRLPYL